MPDKKFANLTMFHHHKDDFQMMSPLNFITQLTYSVLNYASLPFAS